MRHEFDRGKHAASAHFTDERMRIERCMQLLLQIAANFRRILREVLAL
jgi:histone H3/H4